MKHTFRMSKMLKRLQKEGRLSDVGLDELQLMIKLDGRQADDYNWQSVVNDAPLAYIPPADDLPDGAYVNIKDCD